MDRAVRFEKIRCSNLRQTRIIYTGMRVGKRPAVPAFSLIITENSDKEVEWQNKQNVITYRNKMYNIMHKRKMHNISLKYKKSFKINKNLFDKKSIDK